MERAASPRKAWENDNESRSPGETRLPHGSRVVDACAVFVCRRACGSGSTAGERDNSALIDRIDMRANRISASAGGRLSILAPHGALEAVLRVPRDALRGVGVVCHPHPLHGGTMHTKAVYRIAQAMTEAGLAVFRFNYRGVGRSTGSHDGGVGEISFGSMVALRAGMVHERVAAMIGAGLAFDRYDYGFLADARRPLLVVQGERDEFGSGARAEEFVRQLGGGAVEAVVVPGAGHYFHGHFDALRRGVRAFLARPAVVRALERKRGETE